ncbi:Sorting nexin, cytoplasm-to-vacuole targeting pathway/endosomal sorting, partial [Ascosphaera aggregata]
MWNDEDNNPYGSFERPENGDDTTHQNVMNPAADQPYTTSYTREQQTSGYIASMESPESHVGRDQLSSRGGLPYRERSSSVTSSFDDRRLSRAHGNQSDEDDVEAFTRGGHLAEGPGFADDRDEDNRDDLEDIKVDEYGRPVGDLERIAGYGFQNRIQQLLIENPDLPILIVDAGKNVESGGSYIVYTIRTGDLEVRRRYSEFSSLRDILVQLHPTLIVPPIPSKHSMADYAAKPTRAKEDLSIIDLRKRMLQVFLNRCRNMPQIRDDGVWWRFLDPNANWNEVLHSPPASLLPKNLLKAPPINPWNPLPAHGWLPVPSANARLKGTASAASQLSGPGAGDAGALSSLPADVPVGGVSFQSPMAGEFLPRFPPSGRRLSESELDPYFVNYEHSTKELENLLNGSIEKVNRRTLAHLSVMSTDMMELGARLNAFSLSETSRSLASAIEQTGQAFDRCYILTSELNANLSATFAEPMRELAQFASVVRSVVRYRVLKRVQQEMTLDELSKKRAILQSLERSEMEASRINQYLTTRAGGGHGDQTIAAARRVSATHQRGASTPGVRPNAQTASSQYLSPLGQAPHQRENAYHQPPLSTAAAAASPQGNVATEDTSSIDSDFPPQTDKSSTPSWLANPSAEYSGSGLMSIPPPSPVPPQLQQQQPSHRKSSSMTGKLFGRISHAVHGFVDVDPEKTRRDQMGKTKEGLTQLEQALEVSGKDVKLASKGVLADLKRFQEDQEDDLRKYMVAYARCHLDWARKNLETWVDAKDEALKIDVRAAPHVGQLTVTTSSSKRQKSHHRDGHGHPVSGGNHGYHGHRRHRLHSRHHDSQQQQQQQQPHQGDLVEQSRSHTFSHSLATSSPSDLVEKQTRERAELGSDLSSTSTPTGTCERQRSREHTDRHRKGDHLKRWELRRLERKLLKPEVDSAKFLTPATIRRRLRLQNKKSLKWKIELKARRKDNNNRSEGVGREDIKEKSAEISSSEHRFRHGANSQSQPEASPASSLAASTVSTRKRTPTSLALED